jgi:hypothetical protein
MNKNQKKILKIYPNAKLEYSIDGNCTIINNGIDLLREFFLPETTNEDEAWRLALLAMRTKQNFNRTHPARMDLSSLEDKMSRMTRRKLKQYEKFN